MARVLIIFGAAAIVVYLIWKYGNAQSNSVADYFGTDLVGSADGGFTAVTGSNSNVGNDLFSTWADAIFHHEGGNIGQRNVRNNNPGNLKFAGQYGAVGQDAQGFAIFPDAQTGFAALQRQLQKYVNDFPDFSILQIMTRYLGGNPFNPQVTSQGDPFAYADAVAGRLGVSSSDKLKNVFGG